jgi:hypothetical protein
LDLSRLFQLASNSSIENKYSPYQGQPTFLLSFDYKGKNTYLPVFFQIFLHPKYKALAELGKAKKQFFSVNAWESNL